MSRRTVLVLLLLLAAGIALVTALGARLPAEHLLPGDAGAADLAADARSGTLVDAAKLVTDLAWAPVVTPVVLVGTAALVVLGRAGRGLVLICGFVLATLVSHELKALVDRPRPPHGLVATAGASFPSGHSTAAIAYVALAALLAGALLRSAHARAALVAAGVAVAVAIGLTRIELRAHYLSDVLGGWGLGTACYALCALLALLVVALRHTTSRSS